MAPFEIKDTIRIETGQGGLPKVVIQGAHATAEIYLHGAHVTSFVPHGHEPLLWMSSESEFDASRPIRGGVPICWPWFGRIHGRTDLPQHGFARTSQWQLESTCIDEHDNVVVTMRLSDSESTRQIWPHSFQLSVRVSIGKQLTIQLSFLNTGEDPVEVGTAIHTYFAVDRIEDVSVTGLEGRSFVDQLDEQKIKQLNTAVTFDREVDLIAIDSDDVVTISEASSGRRISVSKTGSRSTVVWNPWVNKSKAMADFPDDGYKTMLCVEAANAARDVRLVSPGETHVISQTIKVG